MARGRGDVLTDPFREVRYGAQWGLQIVRGSVGKFLQVSVRAQQILLQLALARLAISNSTTKRTSSASAISASCQASDRPRTTSFQMAKDRRGEIAPESRSSGGMLARVAAPQDSL